MVGRKQNISGHISRNYIFFLFWWAESYTRILQMHYKTPCIYSVGKQSINTKYVNIVFVLFLTHFNIGFWFQPLPSAGRKVLDSVIPQPLPKPSTSPKPQRVTQQGVAVSVASSQPSADLLGLGKSTKN